MELNTEAGGWMRQRKRSVLVLVGESAFENGDPTEKHDRDTAEESSEKHELQHVFAPEHQFEAHGFTTATAQP